MTFMSTARDYQKKPNKPIPEDFFLMKSINLKLFLSYFKVNSQYLLAVTEYRYGRTSQRQARIINLYLMVKDNETEREKKLFVQLYKAH